MQYRITGSVGELPVDLIVELPDAAVRPKRGMSVTAITDEQVVQHIEQSRNQLGVLLSRQADLMVELLASQNKHGRMALSRAYREVWLPLTEALAGKYTQPSLEYGMSVALEKGMPVAYAKAVARKWTGEPPITQPVSVQAEPKYKVV